LASRIKFYGSGSSNANSYSKENISRRIFNFPLIKTTTVFVRYLQIVKSRVTSYENQVKASHCYDPLITSVFCEIHAIGKCTDIALNILNSMLLFPAIFGQSVASHPRLTRVVSRGKSE